MVFNASSSMNGKSTLVFKAIGAGSIITLYKMPKWNSTAYPLQHGLNENDDVTPNVKLDEEYDAPSDWTLIVSYSFGPEDSEIETKYSLDWYK